MHKTWNKGAVLLAAAAAAAALSGGAPVYSALWGEAGEKWTAGGRLPDFSYAGYRSGEVPVPRIPAAGGLNVRDLGARGDGVHDDTQAFLRAIERIARGVVYVPAGRYKITGVLEIRKSNVVLRGDGPDRTTLYFPTPLNEVRPDWGATTTGQRTSNYSWAGGYVWLRGEYGSRVLAHVTGEARRGGSVLALSSTDGLRVGQKVQVVVSDDEAKTLSAHLYSDEPGGMAKLDRTRASLVSRIARVEKNSIELERPLRFDIRAAWRPQVLSFEPTVTESGVEDLRFEFPAGPYKGHFTELGHNPLALTQVADCWVRNVRLSNPDSGPFVSAMFNTIEGIVYESARPSAWKDDPVGHHGVYFGGDDNLFTGFDIRMKFIHDLSVSRCAGNVFSNGRGVDLSFDHHRRTPYENLYTDIDAGLGSRLWLSGGGAALGKHCAARGTFWNVRAKSPLRPPPASWGPPSMNFVALFTELPSTMEEWWFEAIPPDRIQPPDIHKAQRERRLAAGGGTPGLTGRTPAAWR
jgi:hypothetical protein